MGRERESERERKDKNNKTNRNISFTLNIFDYPQLVSTLGLSTCNAMLV